MRIIWMLVGLLAAGMGWMAGEAGSFAATTDADLKADANLIGRIHFIGTTQLLADTNAAAKLNEIAALPETAHLQAELLQTLAAAPYHILKKKAKAGATDQVNRIRPLLEDLLHNEVYAELRGAAKPLPDLLLAVHLDAAHAELWRTNLAIVLTAWSGLPVAEIKVEGFKGWELMKHQEPNVVQLIRVGDWVVLGWGEKIIPGETAMIQRIKTTGRPVEAARDYWLEAWVDGAALRAHELLPADCKLARAQLTLGLKANDVRTKAVLQFSEPLNAKYSGWNIPTNLVHDPIISFTAMRGVAPWLKKIELLKKLKVEPVPDQLYSWAMADILLDNHLAASVENGTNFLEQYGSRLIALANTNLHGTDLGQLQWNTTHTSVEWKGLPPMAAPSVSAASGTNGEYITVQLFPSVPSTEPLSQELVREVASHPDMVYYDWEIVSERLNRWRNLNMLYCLLNNKFFPTAEAPTQRWLTALRTRLGNSTTEASINAPNEMTIVRKSPLGLTSLELVLLTRWLELAGQHEVAESEPNQPPVSSVSGTPTNAAGAK
ncbi:MAG: hypothetical protein JWR19_1327 [Pedosphaera sp.]|nr:hypothetical protein [Pedosphaera sp.]